MHALRLRWLPLAWAFAAVALGSLAHAAPIALVADVVGAGTLRGTPLRLLAELDAGSEIDVAEGGRVVVFYLADGAEWTLTGRGRYRLATGAPQANGTAPPPQRNSVAAPLVAVKLRTDRAVQGGLQMRGGAERPALVAPLDETLLDNDVAFVWEPAGPGTTYRFELVDAAGAKVYGVDTVASTVRLPGNVTLTPGMTYRWAIGGRDPDAPQPFYRAGEFHVADAATRAQLRDAQPRADAPFADRVLYVAVLERAGARSAARALRARLTPERPAAWATPR